MANLKAPGFTKSGGSTKRNISAVTSAEFTQVDYATGTGLYRDGSQDWPGFNELSLRSNLIEPLPDDGTLKEFKLEQHAEPIGKSKINCVTLHYPLPSNMTVSKDFFPGFCFETTIPVLRLISHSGGAKTGLRIDRRLSRPLSGARVEHHLQRKAKDRPET
jgi:hypothetical protein